MTLRKPVAAETLELFEYAKGIFLAVAVRPHSLDQFFPEVRDQPLCFECRHASAQFIGFGRCKAGRNDRDLHGLFLE